MRSKTSDTPTMEAAKQELYRLRKLLHERRATPEVQSFLSLLELLRRAADSLVDCPPEVFQRLQGEAKGYKRAIEMVMDYKPLEQNKGE